MSGTSLDGVDLAYVQLQYPGSYTILQAQTIPYSAEWRNRLTRASELPSAELLRLNAQYGKYLGEQCLTFMRERGIAKAEVDFLASHGHTIFHAPADGYTYQIGVGPELNAVSGITTVTDFRTADVALGGQGAPLVPIGDRDLFSQYDGCLNLGGFANISLTHTNQRIAFDICPVNFVLNPLAQALGKPYDADGEIARKGTIQTELLQALNALNFYRQKPPKSLGAEWVQSNIESLLTSAQAEPKDLLATFTEHAAAQISATLKAYALQNVLVTGGGAYNQFLLQRVKAKFKGKITVPDSTTIEFKEALIFAWLGLLKLRNENNVLASVTGARRNHSAGIVYS